jgi:hypothetical protein
VPAVSRPSGWRQLPPGIGYDAPVQAFDIAAIPDRDRGGSGYISHRVLKLPPTNGTLAVALVSSLVLVAAEHLYPGWHSGHRSRRSSSESTSTRR